MKPNPLLLAVVVLAVLGGLVYYTNENPPEPESDTVSIIDVEAADVSRITIDKPDGESIIVMRGEDDTWRFGGGLEIPADDSAVSLIASNLASMNADRVVQEETTDWTPFGLSGENLLSVRMEPKEGEPTTVLFGGETPTGSGVFARIEGDPRLFTVYNYVKSSFEKSVSDLRDKKLLRLDADSVTALKVDLGDKAFEFAKSGAENWTIVRPLAVRADNFNVGDLFRSVQNAEMLEVLAENDDVAANAYSFARTYGVAEVIDAAGAHVLTIGKNNDATYYAKSSDLPGGVYEMTSSVAEGLDKDLDDFRNKKLFDFGFAELIGIDVRDGETTARVEKQEDKWILASDGDRELESEKVQQLIDSLRNLTAVAFPSDDAGEQAAYGLTSPSLEAEVVLAEVAADSERVLISDLGRDRVYAARKGEPSSYEIEKAPAEEVRRAIEELLAPAEEESEE